MSGAYRQPNIGRGSVAIVTAMALAFAVSACGVAPSGGSGSADYGFDGLIFLNISSSAPASLGEGGIELYSMDPADGRVENIHSVTTAEHGIIAPSQNPVGGVTPAHVLRSRLSPNFERYTSVQGTVALIIDLAGKTSSIAPFPAGPCTERPLDAVFSVSGEIVVLHETCDDSFAVSGEDGSPIDLEGVEQLERVATQGSNLNLVIWPEINLLQLGDQLGERSVIPSPSGRYAALGSYCCTDSGSQYPTDIVSPDGGVVARSDRSVDVWIDDERFIYGVRGSAYGIAQVDPASGSVLTVNEVPNSAFPDLGKVEIPVVSPDHQWMAVDGDASVSVINLMTGERREFAKPGGRLVDWVG